MNINRFYIRMMVSIICMYSGLLNANNMKFEVTYVNGKSEIVIVDIADFEIQESTDISAVESFVRQKIDDAGVVSIKIIGPTVLENSEHDNKPLSALQIETPPQDIQLTIEETPQIIDERENSKAAKGVCAFATVLVAAVFVILAKELHWMHL